MAENNETILIDVQLDAGKVSAELDDISRQIANVKNEQKQLDAEYKAGKITLTEYTKSSAAMKDELTWLQKQQKGLVATTKLMTAETTTYSDSLNGQRQKLADMQKAYDQMDAAMRESEGGQKFLQKIREQNEAVMELEKATGRAQRNVGNYPTVITSVIPGFDKLMGSIDKLTAATSATPAAFGNMAKGIGTATKAALKFIATPIGAIIMAVAAAVKLLSAGWDKLTEAIAKNDDAGTAIARLYEVTIQPVVDLTAKAFGKLAEWIGNVANKLADWLGGSEKAADAAHSLVVATDELQEAERQYTINSAARSAEIAKLRDKAAAKDQYTAAERRKFLQEAIDLEKQNLEDDKKIKAEQLRILEATAKREQDTSDETKNKIAEARAAMSQAEEAYYSGTRRLNTQLATLNIEIQKEADDKAAARTKEKEERAAKEAEITKKQAELEAEIRRKSEDLAVQLIGEAGARAIAQRKLQGDREIQALQHQLETERNLTDKAKEDLRALIANKQKALNTELEKMANDAAQQRILEEQAATLKSQREIVELKKQVAQEGSAELLALQLEALELQKQEELAKYAEGTQERLLIDQQYEQAKAEMEEQYRTAKMQSDLDTMQQALSMVSNLNNSISKIENAQLTQYKRDQEDKKNVLKKRLDAGLISETEYNKQIAEIDAETEKREVEMERAQAKREKALNIFSTILSTASAIIGFLANPGGIPGIALSAMAGVMGAAQIAAIAAQPLPQLATGGVIPGRFDGKDDQPVMLSKGETVLNPTQAGNILYDLANNRGGLGGGLDYELLGETTAAAVAQLPAPVMVYKEFNEFADRTANFTEIAKI